jgi:hypothetical protein
MNSTTPTGEVMIYRGALLALLALVMAGCGSLADTRHNAALRRWQAQPIGHYLLRTREEVGGRICGQTVEVRDEAVVQILNNTCTHPTLWTISWLFEYAARSQAAVERCARYESDSGCICRDAIDVQVEYEPALGYPGSITIRQAWQPAWQSTGYWRYILRHAELPNCTPPFSDLGRRITVRDIRPLP